MSKAPTIGVATAVLENGDPGIAIRVNASRPVVLDLNTAEDFINAIRTQIIESGKKALRIGQGEEQVDEGV